MGAPGKARGVNQGSRGHYKDQQAAGDSNAGAIAEDGGLVQGKTWVLQERTTAQGGGVPAAKERVRTESKNRAGVDKPTLEGRSVGAQRSQDRPQAFSQATCRVARWSL